ncbi:MAG: hypothetical protein CL946_12790 [Ectothiorhodospiraceae bacterium]|nr:hypothetical protein [Ectothiorhodospiraceae bacterium]
MENHKLKFSVDSALLRELGEKLVESVHLALVELVKNAYDADATMVEVTFSQNENGENQIVIIDDGTGMNFQDVEKYWMRIATTQKTQNDVSPIYGRPRTGAKGIGRFSCRRLGNKLNLITMGTEKGGQRGRQCIVQKTQVEFAWDNFPPGTDVTTIECPGRRETVPTADTGTTLIITMDPERENEWSTRGYGWLKRQLAVLAANRGTRRPEFEEDPGFNIYLFAPQLEEGIKDLRTEMFNAGWGTLKAFINKNNQAVCELDALGIGTKSHVSRKTFDALHDVSLELGILIDKKEHLRDKRVLSLGNLKDILGRWGGVQVRYRGFRVYPYGDDDWLNIDRDRGLRRPSPRGELFAFAQTLKGINPRRALLNMVSMRSYVGSVEIGPNASGFEMKASREGFVESPALRQLKEFTRYAIDWATIYYEFYLKSKQKKESALARAEFEEITNETVDQDSLIESAIQYIQQEVDIVTKELPPLEKKEKERALFSAAKVIKTQYQADKRELMQLRLMASTSILLLVFSHEVRSLLALLGEGTSGLQTLAEQESIENRAWIRQLSEEFEDTKERFQDLLGLTSLIGVDSRDGKPKQLTLRRRVERSIRVFELIIKRYSIKIDIVRIPDTIITTSLSEAELMVVLINPISNSIKSVIAGGSDRRIAIAAKRFDGLTKVHISDSGLGLDPENFDKVFEPFVSDPHRLLYSKFEDEIEDDIKHIVGAGSGLGLSIIKEILEARGGEVRFIEPHPNWKCTLEILAS